MKRIERLQRRVRIVSIALLAIALLVFLVCSALVYKVSIDSPHSYETQYRSLSNNQKSIIKSMKKTGEIESKVAGKNRNTGGNGTFVEEVQKNHRKDK